MIPKIRIREIKKSNLEEGYLIDGFPSVGFSSAIATESMIHTSKFELGGVIDSEVPTKYKTPFPCWGFLHSCCNEIIL